MGARVAYFLQLALALLASVALGANVIDCPVCTEVTHNAINDTRVGGFITRITAINTEMGSAVIAGYVWMSWVACRKDLTGRPFRPDLSVILINVVDRTSSATFSPAYVEPLCFAELPGRFYQRWLFEAVFGQSYDFSRYPLDVQNISVVMQDLQYSAGRLVYEQDDEQRYAWKGVRVNGWTTSNGWARVALVSYGSTFGLSNVTDASTGTVLTMVAQYSFGLVVSRGPFIYIFRCLPPVLVSLLVQLMLLALDVTEMSTRVGSALGGLLTIVFLQFTLTIGVPKNLDYLTFLDWIFLFSYVVTLLVVVECFVVYFMYLRMKHIERGTEKKGDKFVHSVRRKSSPWLGDAELMQMDLVPATSKTAAAGGVTPAVRFQDPADDIRPESESDLILKRMTFVDRVCLLCLAGFTIVGLVVASACVALL